MDSALPSSEANLRPAEDPELADAAHTWKSAYVHIPFCRRRCPYCDFAIVDESHDRSVSHTEYVEAVHREIGMEGRFGPLDAVNFGGGTPSLVEPELLAGIVAELSARFGLRAGAEVSIEINPEDWSSQLGAGLVEAGFNRISIGAQSMDGVILGALGRQHAPAQVADAVSGARKAGVRSIGVDVMIGHPAESSASWAATMRSILGLEVDHVSSYTLTVEPGTALSRQVLDGARAPDEDEQADRYDGLVELATAAGIRRYEVSNHAKSGHACRYNLSTWAHGEYLGFGLGAHDHRWGLRSRNHRRMDRYMESLAAGERPRLGTETLTPSEQDRDRLMLGLRLAAGTPMTAAAARFIDSAPARRFIDAGLVEVRDDRIVVTDPMRADAVAREALSVSGSDC